MRILILQHGLPPLPGRPVTGIGLRAFANGSGLRARGHSVLYATRSEDRATGRPPSAGELSTGDELGVDDGLAPAGGLPGAPGNPLSFTEPHELHALVERVDPDVVLVEALEEARSLPDGRFAVVLDLFAPRLLEQQWQPGSGDREATRVLDALSRADHFVFSNERQKHFHLPLLALAGVDLRHSAGSVVPISCPPELPSFRKPKRPVFVAGGVFWPWADLSAGLRDLLDLLDERGEGRVDLYGGEYGIRSDTTAYSDPRAALPKRHKRLKQRGMVPIDTLWTQYARASVAFDLPAPNPEREINLSFRQIDYLRCGLPLITAPSQVIAADIEVFGAGWLVEPGDKDTLSALIHRLLDDPATIAAASSAAQRLAREKYSWEHTLAPLDAWLRAPVRRQRTENAISRLARTQADLWEQSRGALRLQERLDDLEEGASKKSAEVKEANRKIWTLLGTVDRLTASLDEVTRFKSEALSYLGGEKDEATRDLQEAERELSRRDLELKRQAQSANKAKAEVKKLKGAIAELKADNQKLQSGYAEADRQRQLLADAESRLHDRIARIEGELLSLQRELADRQDGLVNARRTLLRAEQRSLEQLDRAEAAARDLLEDAADRIASLQDREALLKGRLDQRSARVRDLQRLLRSGDGVNEQLKADNEQLQRAASEVEELGLRLIGLERDVQKKNEELLAAHAERNGFEQQLVTARDRLAAIEAQPSIRLRRPWKR